MKVQMLVTRVEEIIEILVGTKFLRMERQSGYEHTASNNENARRNPNQAQDSHTNSTLHRKENIPR